MPARACSIEECVRPAATKGWCGAHYARWRRTGNPGPATIAPPGAARLCTVPDCGRPHKAQGLCGGHYQRWTKSGAAGTATLRATGDPSIRDEHGRKLCTCCRQWKPVDDFLKESKTADGIHPHCYRCHRARVIKNKYGITIEQYEGLLEKQNGGCAICGCGNKDGRLLAVDHDHACCPGEQSCGRCTRSLLCTKCNTGLGAFGDDIGLLEAAIAYVKEHGRRRE